MLDQQRSNSASRGACFRGLPRPSSEECSSASEFCGPAYDHTLRHKTTKFCKLTKLKGNYLQGSELLGLEMCGGPWAPLREPIMTPLRIIISFYPPGLRLCTTLADFHLQTALFPPHDTSCYICLNPTVVITFCRNLSITFQLSFKINNDNKKTVKTISCQLLS